MEKQDNKILWIIGSLGVIGICGCIFLFIALIGLFGFGAPFARGVSPATPTTVVTFPTATIFADSSAALPTATATPQPTSEQPTSTATSAIQLATPTIRPRPTDLDEVDLESLREAWDFIQQNFDGPLPTQEELEQTIVQCSRDEVTGDQSSDFDPDATRTPLESFPDGAIRPDDLDDMDLGQYYAAWAEMQATYNGELPSQNELRDLTIGCSVASLGDPFTRYISPEDAARDREDMSGTFEGIGAFVRMNDDDMMMIVRPMDGQPADLAGLRAGDLVIGIDGENVIGQSQSEIINKIRGPRGTEVLLTIRREGEADFEVSIIRARIEVEIVTAEMLDNGIAYVRLSDFSGNAEAQLTEAVAGLLAQNPKGLIFDLRDNPGGFLSQAVSVADLFLGENPILYERNSSGEEQTFRAENGDVAEQIQMATLINAGSASAAEIVAGALRDNGRSILIGETTFGKGSVQIPHTLTDGSQVNVTIARWYLPSKTTIDAIGVAPEIVVESPDTFDILGDDDIQLQRAIDFLLNGQ